MSAEKADTGLGFDGAFWVGRGFIFCTGAEERKFCEKVVPIARPVNPAMESVTSPMIRDSIVERVN